MAACVAAAAPAVAQTQTERPTGGPFTGLFKGSPKSQPHTLDLQASGFAAWDDNLVNLAPGGSIGNALDAVDPRLLKQGVASGFQGSVNYGFHKGGTRSQFSLGGNASVQEFASALSADPFWFHSYGGSTSLTTKVTSKTSISFAGGAAYAPFYQYAPFLANTASEESPVGTDYGYAVNSAWVRSASASASVSNQFSKRSTISAGLSWDQRVIPANEDSSIDTRAISTRFSHSLT